jgi:hypothetical protein
LRQRAPHLGSQQLVHQPQLGKQYVHALDPLGRCLFKLAPIFNRSLERCQPALR